MLNVFVAFVLDKSNDNFVDGDFKRLRAFFVQLWASWGACKVYLINFHYLQLVFIKGRLASVYIYKANICS